MPKLPCLRDTEPQAEIKIQEKLENNDPKLLQNMSKSVTLPLVNNKKRKLLLDANHKLFAAFEDFKNIQLPKRRT